MVMDKIASLLTEPENLRVLVVGLDAFGMQAARVLEKLGAEVVATDERQELEGIDSLLESGVRLELGGKRTELVKRADLVVLSPRVRIGALASAMAIEARSKGVPTLGELELAHRLLGSGQKHSILAITGSRGKSMTAALCGHLLSCAGLQVFVGGDAARPLTELFLSGNQVDWLVLEVSSLQLEHLSAPGVFVPNVGIWLNLFPDRLERHITMRNYGRVKRRLFEGMSATDTGVFWLDDSMINQQHEGLECAISGVSRNPARVPLVGALLVRQEITPNGWDHPITLSNELLIDDVSAENAACAAGAALAIGLDEQVIQSGLDSFAGVQAPDRNEA